MTEYDDEIYRDMYRLGREAREADYKETACNIRGMCAKRGWWLAGWHDRDIELSGPRYHK